MATGGRYTKEKKNLGYIVKTNSLRLIDEGNKLGHDMSKFESSLEDGKLHMKIVKLCKVLFKSKCGLNTTAWKDIRISELTKFMQDRAKMQIEPN